MKKATSILFLVLIAFTNVLATMINEQQSLIQTLCEASNESSEEKCDTKIINGAQLKANYFDTRFLLYKNPEKPDEYHEIFINNLSSIINAKPFSKKTAVWKILVHGFTNDKDSTFPVNVKNAYLNDIQQNPNNILVFDWGKGAKKDWLSPFRLKEIYQNAVENVQIAGRKLGDMIMYLHKEKFLDITEGVHLVGHSLGAHVCGDAAHKVSTSTELLVWRISALDPAGPLFWNNAVLSWLHDSYPRLHRNRASFLDVYHTSEWYGSMEEMGDVDFYINGGQSQPFCKYRIPKLFYLLEQKCSHQFAAEIFAKSIANKDMIACTGCFSYGEFHNNECECDEDDKVVLGEHVVDDGYYGYPLAAGEAFYDTK